MAKLNLKSIENYKKKEYFTVSEGPLKPSNLKNLGRGRDACTIIHITDDKYLIVPSRLQSGCHNNDIPNLLNEAKLCKVEIADIEFLNNGSAPKEVKACEFVGDGNYMGLFKDDNDDLKANNVKQLAIFHNLCSQVKQF